MPSEESDRTVSRSIFRRTTWSALSANIHQQAARLIVTADRREIKDDFSVLLQGNRLAQDQRDRPTAWSG